VRFGTYQGRLLAFRMDAIPLVRDIFVHLGCTSWYEDEEIIRSILYLQVRYGAGGRLTT